MSSLDSRPITNSYWAVDGALLAGEYPGAWTEAAARRRLERFLDAGVRLFLDLTEEGELEPYDEILRALAEERGITVEHRRMPIRDASVPRRAEAMAAILDAIDTARSNEILAYVHCWGGIGRTGTVVGCLFRREGRSGEEALAELGRRWGTMEKAPSWAGSPETPEQARYVEEWVEAMGGSKGRASSPDRAERIAGCLLAGAAGDALGAPVEFLSLEAIRRKYGPAGIRDLDEAYGRVGAITDDTQMTLFTAEGLLRARSRREERGEDETGEEETREVVHRAYLRWLATQGRPAPGELGDRGWLMNVPALNAQRAPGRTCLGSLQSGSMGSRALRINDSKGCGGVMRAGPAGLVGADDPFALGCDVAALTHSHPAGFLSAGCLACLIARILEGDSLEVAVEAARGRLAEEPEHEETSAAVRRAVELTGEGEPTVGPTPETVERLGEGWIAEEALAIALFCCLVHPDDLEAALILAANHSGDTDSTAAIAGNIMGALLGIDAIPGRWLGSLELREVIERVAEDLVVGYEASPEWRERYPPS